MTLRPTRDEFKALAATHTAVPVWRELLADLITPVAAFLRCVSDEPGFLLESVEHERWGRFSFVGRRPAATLVSRGGRITVDGGPLLADVPPDAGVLDTVERLLAAYRAPTLDGLPPFHGGLVGYIGYDVVREVERLPDVPPDDLGLPDAVLLLVGDLAVFDHWLQRVSLISVAYIPPGSSDAELDRLYDDAVGRIDALAQDGARPLD